jgi:hypothetical protein
MTNWKVGDIAIIRENTHCTPSFMESFRGHECTLVRKLWWSFKYDWKIEIQGWAHGADVQETALRPLPPPNELASWEDCVFKPRELVDA